MLFYKNAVLIDKINTMLQGSVIYLREIKRPNVFNKLRSEQVQWFEVTLLMGFFLFATGFDWFWVGFAATSKRGMHFMI